MTSPARSYRMTARARGVEQTRERILAVARDRFEEKPYEDITLNEIALSAGVSHQTLLNHFTSKEGLLLALADAFRQQIEGLRGTVEPGDVTGAVRGLVRQYERLGDANIRMAVLADRIPAVADLIADGRANHLAWLEQVFAKHLPDDPRARRRALGQLYAVTDVFTWKLLRRDLKHSRTDTTTILQSTLRAVLTTLPAS